MKFDPRYGSPWGIIGALTALIVAAFLFSIRPAHAINHGFDPDSSVTKWFESKQRPDYPGSCCGKGDAYPIARYRINADHTISAWVDVSASEDKIYPDGTRRGGFDPEQEIIIPDNKLNKPDDDLDNPTDMSWLFMSRNTRNDPGTIYCFVAHPSGN